MVPAWAQARLIALIAATISTQHSRQDLRQPEWPRLRAHHWRRPPANNYFFECGHWSQRAVWLSPDV